MALQSGQYVARDKDNVAKNPQPGDTEVTDAFGNVFDNFNTDWVDYDKDNAAVNPQPAYQNLDYVQYNFDNTPASPVWQPDAAQWVARGFDNQVRTPQPYAKSPLFPTGLPVSFTPSTFDIVLRATDSEALIVTEDDVAEIKLELSTLQIRGIPSIAKFK